jgi:hypothetical protein
MTEPIIDASLVEPLNDEERELMDPASCDWDSAQELPPVANPGIVLAVRFSREQIRRVTAAATEAGVTVDAFAKLAVRTGAAQGAPRYSHVQEMCHASLSV